MINRKYKVEWIEYRKVVTVVEAFDNIEAAEIVKKMHLNGELEPEGTVVLEFSVNSVKRVVDD